MVGHCEIKVCGLTNAEDARAALALGVEYVGFVLYAGSPRGIDRHALAGILEAVGQPCRAIGVFVNETPAVVAEVARACALHAVQIHGDERAEDFARMPVPVWRAVRIEPGGNGPAPPPEQWPAAVRYVVDAAGAGKYGGSGRVADWAAAAGLARSHPVMLAGGLRAGNVARAIRAVRPLGVDVSSGVESRPGKKDLGQLEAFVRNARGIR